MDNGDRKGLAGAVATPRNVVQISSPDAAQDDGLALVLGAAGDALAGAEAGRQKAQVCAACHGANGNSSQAMFPSLAGQPKQPMPMDVGPRHERPCW